MRSLHQSVQVKAILMLLLVISPVDLEFRLRSEKPPCARRSLTAGLAPRAAAITWDSNIFNTTANSSTPYSNSGPAFTDAPASASATAHGRGNSCTVRLRLATSWISSGVRGAAADLSDQLQWGGKGEFAGGFQPEAAIVALYGHLWGCWLCLKRGVIA